MKHESPHTKLHNEQNIVLRELLSNFDKNESGNECSMGNLKCATLTKCLISRCLELFSAV